MKNMMQGLREAMPMDEGMPDDMNSENGDGSIESLLDEAILLHQKHMDGTEPTDESSQARLMQLLIDARVAL